MAFLHRVGTTVNDETSAVGRTREFGSWWAQTSKDSFHQYMTDIRHNELKSGIVTYIPRPFVERLRVVTRRAARRLNRIARMYPGMSNKSVLRHQGGGIAASDRITGTPRYQYSFAKGSFANQDVVTLINRYLEWLETVVLPTSERLMERTKG